MTTITQNTGHATKKRAQQHTESDSKSAFISCFGLSCRIVTRPFPRLFLARALVPAIHPDACGPAMLVAGALNA